MWGFTGSPCARLLAAALLLLGCGPSWPGAVFRAGEGARAWSHLRFANDPENFQFAVVTDRTGGHRPGVFPGILERVNLLQPELVMSVGDYIEGYTEDRQAAEAEWAEVDAIIAKLDAPFFFVVGNHDYSNEMMAGLWRERMGRSYYHFVYRDVLFVALNTEDPPAVSTPESRAAWDRMVAISRSQGSEAAHRFRRENELLRAQFGSISDEQRDWALSVLAEHPNVRWTFFFLHKPVWQYDIPNFLAIEESLAGRGYTMFAGHEHNYAHVQRGGRDYIRQGTSGGGWAAAGGRGTNLDHVTWVTMRDDGPVFAILVARGILPADGVPDFVPGAEFCGDDLEIPCVFATGSGR